jgi:hypothetical protein
MAKFSVGQRVEIAFNPPTPDPRVPDQVNGKAPGRGQYQTKPNFGEILEARETAEGCSYLVAVELLQPFERNGKKRVAKSVRQNVISEAKLRAVG